MIIHNILLQFAISQPQFNFKYNIIVNTFLVAIRLRVNHDKSTPFKNIFVDVIIPHKSQKAKTGDKPVLAFLCIFLH